MIVTRSTEFSVESRVLSIACRLHPAKEPLLHSTFDELGFDLLDRYEFATDLEDEFFLNLKVWFDDETETFAWRTLQDAANAVRMYQKRLNLAV